MFKEKKYVSILFIIIIVFVLIIEVFPIYWIFTNAFKSYKEIAFYPPTFIFKPSFENFIDIFQRRDFLKVLFNSLLISSASVFFSVWFGSMAAFALVRLKFGGNTLLFFLISSRMLPLIILLIPIYMIFTEFHLRDSYIGLISIYTTFTMSFTVWQMVSFFKSIPRGLEEAAIIDGCNLWQVYYKIILPISMPGLVAVAIFSYFGAYNEFLFASILTGKKIMTIPIFLSGFLFDRSIPWGPMSAASVMAMIPIMLIVFLLQKQIISGLIAGAIKE